MRQPQYTLTPAHVQAHACVRIPKHLRLADPGRTCTADTRGTVLVYAASRILSWAAAWAALRDAPSDTAAHDALLATLPGTAELPRRRHRALPGDRPHALRRRRQPLAIDLTLIPYHGKPLRDLDEIYRGKAQSGTRPFHAQATACVLQKGRRFTVALTSVGRHEALPAVRQRLRREAARVGVRPRYLLWDRGFCRVDVMRYLPNARCTWLMPLLLRGRKADPAKAPSGSQVFAGRKRSGGAEYPRTHARKRPAWFRVCIKGRNRRGERGRHGREAWVQAFGGPLRPSSSAWVKETYRSRFAIETRYRPMHPAWIRTCTRDPLLRLLYVGVALILRNVWVWLHGPVLAHRPRGGRRMDLGPLRFGKMLVWLQQGAEARLGIHDEIATEHRMYE